MQLITIFCFHHSVYTNCFHCYTDTSSTLLFQITSHQKVKAFLLDLLIRFSALVIYRLLFQKQAALGTMKLLLHCWWKHCALILYLLILCLWFTTLSKSPSVAHTSKQVFWPLRPHGILVPWHWKRRVLTAEPPGKYQQVFFSNCLWSSSYLCLLSCFSRVRLCATP